MLRPTPSEKSEKCWFIDKLLNFSFKRKTPTGSRGLLEQGLQRRDQRGGGGNHHHPCHRALRVGLHQEEDAGEDEED